MKGTALKDMHDLCECRINPDAHPEAQVQLTIQIRRKEEEDAKQE